MPSCAMLFSCFGFDFGDSCFDPSHGVAAELRLDVPKKPACHSHALRDMRVCVSE